MITEGPEKADVSHLKTLQWLFMSWRVQECFSVLLRKKGGQENILSEKEVKLICLF